MKSENFCNLKYMDDYIEEIRKNVDRKIVLYGTGDKSKAIYELLTNFYVDLKIWKFCDSDREKIGKKLYDIDIVEFEEIKNEKICIIVCCAVNNYIEIEKFVKSYGEYPIYHMCYPFKTGGEWMNKQYIDIHMEELTNIFSLLEDDLSKKIFLKNIEYKLTGNIVPLLQNVDGDYFDRNFIHIDKNSVYVDCGACTGDTFFMFLMSGNGAYKKAYLIDPDYNNCKCMERLIKYSRIDELSVKIINKATYDSMRTMKFFTTDADLDNPYENGCLNERNKPTSVLSSAKRLDERIVDVQADLLDSMLIDEEYPTILKVNTFTADLETITGAEQIIRKHKPNIIIELGSKLDEYEKIILKINSINSNYKFYLRQKMLLGDCKTVIYAI